MRTSEKEKVMSTEPAMVKLSSTMKGIISAAYSEGIICLGNLKVINSLKYRVEQMKWS